MQIVRSKERKVSKCTAVDTGCWEGSRHWAHFLSFSHSVGHQVPSSSTLTPAQALPNHCYFVSVFECSFSCLGVMYWVCTARFRQWEHSQTLSIPEPSSRHAPGFVSALPCSDFVCLWRRGTGRGGLTVCKAPHVPPCPPWAHTCTPCSSLVQGRQCGRKGSTPYVCFGSQAILGKL